MNVTLKTISELTGHSRELSATTVSALERMSTKTRDLGQVEADKCGISKELSQYSVNSPAHPKRSISQLTASADLPVRTSIRSSRARSRAWRRESAQVQLLRAGNDSPNLQTSWCHQRMLWQSPGC